jgi:hypothetical protein
MICYPTELLVNVYNDALHIHDWLILQSSKAYLNIDHGALLHVAGEVDSGTPSTIYHRLSLQFIFASAKLIKQRVEDHRKCYEEQNRTK